MSVAAGQRTADGGLSFCHCCHDSGGAVDGGNAAVRGGEGHGVVAGHVVAVGVDDGHGGCRMCLAGEHHSLQRTAVVDAGLVVIIGEGVQHKGFFGAVEIIDGVGRQLRLGHLVDGQSRAGGR